MKKEKRFTLRLPLEMDNFIEKEAHKLGTSKTLLIRELLNKFKNGEIIIKKMFDTSQKL